MREADRIKNMKIDLQYAHAHAIIVSYFTTSSMLNSPLIHLIGKTGSGKSEYLLKTIHDRITKEMIIVLDPHGDITEKILAKSDPEEKKHIILMNLPENPNDI